MFNWLKELFIIIYIYNIMRFSDKTNYKKIYSKTYWGGFSYNEDNLGNYSNWDDVFKNRNEFIDKYNIDKIYSGKSSKYWDYMNELQKEREDLSMDHIEHYITKDKKHLFLNSPYANEDSSCVQNLINDGWIKINKMYAPDAISFIKYIEFNKKTNKENLNKFYKNLSDDKKIITCESCGEKFSYFNKSKHEKTKIHRILSKKFNNINCEK